MIPVKFGPFRTNRFKVIAIFVNLILALAAILSFARFNFWLQSRLQGAETKLGLKFGENRAYGFEVIEFLVFFKMAAGGHLGFQNLKFWSHILIEGEE